MPSPVSTPARRPRFRLLSRALQLTGSDWLLLVTALRELLLARLALACFTMETLTAPPGIRVASIPATQQQMALAARISWAIQSAAARVPWRSDCLVQALAARRWLTRQGVPSELNLGVRVNASNIIEAHAWLRCDEVVVTGGRSDDYLTLLQTGTRRP